MRRDPILRDAIKRIGPCLMADRQRKDHLTALVGAIVSQQLSTKAAATIFGRFAALFPDGQIAADGIRALTDQQLRGVGFSSQKIGYLRDLCDKHGILFIADETPLHRKLGVFESRGQPNPEETP